MAQRTQKHVVLILARELASNLATPTLIADDRGNLVFYNEAAETLLGRSFAELGELPGERWTAMFAPRTLDGEPLGPGQTPGGVALRTRRAAHVRFRITSLDGVEREISATAVPLFAHADELVGVMSVFWSD